MIAATKQPRQEITDAIFCFDLGTVRFAVHPEGPAGPRLLAEIDEYALRDHFGARGGPEGLVRTYHQFANVIQAAAIAKLTTSSAAQVKLGLSDFDPAAQPMP